MGRFGFGFGSNITGTNVAVLGGGGLPVPVNIVPPVISGSQVNGSLMSCTTGTWDNAPTSYTYQWTRDSVPIGGATANTYTTVPADGLAELRCEVTATNATGSSAPAISNAINIDEYVAFVSIWDTEKTDATASPSLTIVLPMSAGPEVDWGDGTINNLNSHVYAAPGQKTITIDNTNSDFRFANAGDKIKIIDVTQCNGLNVTNTNMFERCKDMTWTATDAPNITTTNLSAMFLGAEALNGGGSLGSWDVSLVENFTNMFFGAFAFVGMDIENWDVGNCSKFTQMFFATHALAAPIGVWDMSSATNIGGMFRSNNGFNQDLSGWDVSNCTKFNHVFAGSSSFNHDISNWDMGSAVTVHAMFSSNNFNGDITGWTFSSAIKDVSWIFAGNSSFNQDISGWNVASATNFSNMFGNASSFNQDLTSWNLGSATNLTTMLDNCGMNTANYDAFLINLDGQTINSGLTLGAQGRTYTLGGAGETARTSLVNNDSMSILGDSGV